MNNAHQRIDNNTFSQLSQQIEEELINGHLGSALSIMTNLLEMLSDIHIYNRAKEEVDSAKDNYQRLLHYMKEGTEDPQRHSVRTKIKHKLFGVLQDLRRSYLVSTMQDKIYENPYVQTITIIEDGKEQQLLQGILSHPELTEMFQLQDGLFDIVWILPQLSKSQEKELGTFLENTTTKLQCYVMSALTMALLHYFDPAKFRLLIAHATSQSIEVRTRAIVGMCIIAQIWSHQLMMYPMLADDVVSIMQQPGYLEELALIQHNIYLYQEAEKLEQKFVKEVIPTLIKVTQQRHKLGFDDMELDLTDPESTPNINKQTRRMLYDSMQEMARLMRTGMDVNLHTFTSLKSFSFFNKVGHWLAPFDTTRPEVNGNEMIDVFPLCDSDKYSIASVFTHTDNIQFESLKKLLEENAKDLVKQPISPKSEYRNIIQCLYRLLKRSPWASLWKGVFTPDMMFINNPLFKKLITSSPQYLSKTGNMLLRFKNYEAAGKHLSQLAQVAGTDSQLLMQLGLCMQQTGKFSSAISYYQQARMLEPDNQDILYRLQYCLAQKERYQEQLECLLELEEKSPENSKILTEVGLCLIQLERWEEAERRFYKLEFLGKRVAPSLRAIAWCCLNRGEYETAKNLYLRLFNERPSEVIWEDYLNIGHTVWLLGDVAAAIAFYGEYAHRYLIANPEAKDALVPFTKDNKLLLSKGMSQEDIDIMYDLISEQL